MTPARRPSAGDRARRGGRLVQRLAVLLTAGLAPLAAVRAIERPPPELAAAAACDSPYDVPRRMVDAAAAGTAVRDRRVGAARRGVDGRPRIGRAARGRARQGGRFAAGARRRRREVEVALAGPIATARIVLALPALGLGWGCCSASTRSGCCSAPSRARSAVRWAPLLIAIGVRWNRRLVAAARRYDPLPGSAPSCSRSRSRVAARRSAPRRSSPTRSSGRNRRRLREAAQTLAFAGRAGVPVGGAAARRGRARARLASRRGAAAGGAARHPTPAAARALLPAVVRAARRRADRDRDPARRRRLVRRLSAGRAIRSSPTVLR